jgi:hypothetical protein
VAIQRRRLLLDKFCLKFQGRRKASNAQSSNITAPTTLDIYTQGDGDETRAAQGAFLKELGMASDMIQ